MPASRARPCYSSPSPAELERLDAAIFADTQWEPAAVYAHLERLKAAAAEGGIPIYTVTAGNLRDDVLAARTQAQHFVTIPYYVRTASGERGKAKRQCTRDYKIRPIRRQVRALMKAAGAKVAEQWFGISLDEMGRMRTSDVGYLEHRYPLVDARLTRWDCQLWLAAHGWEAPRSACIGCPFHSDHEWRQIKADPVEWADAVEADRAVRSGRQRNGDAYLHASLVPLDEVDLSTPEDHGQLNLFEQECQGMCGL